MFKVHLMIQDYNTNKIGDMHSPPKRVVTRTLILCFRGWIFPLISCNLCFRIY